MDSDNLKQLLNMEQQKNQFSNLNSDLILKSNRLKLQKILKLKLSS